MSIEFSRQEYWRGLPFPSPGDLPWPRDQTQISCIVGRFFTICVTRDAHESRQEFRPVIWLQGSPSPVVCVWASGSTWIPRPGLPWLNLPLLPNPGSGSQRCEGWGTWWYFIINPSDSISPHPGLMPQGSGSQSKVPGWAITASPGKWLKMQNFRPESLGVEFSDLSFNKPWRWFWWH